MKFVYSAFGVAMFVLSGCVPSTSFESDPVRVPTTKGDVICQLYTKDVVLWDHALSHPKTMQVEEADRICYFIGQKQANS